MVRTRASRLRTLRRIIAGLPGVACPSRQSRFSEHRRSSSTSGSLADSSFSTTRQHGGQLTLMHSQLQPHRLVAEGHSHCFTIGRFGTWGAPRRLSLKPEQRAMQACSILLSLVQLQSETDAHRSHFLQHQPSRQSLRRDSACMPRYAAMTSTSLLWQRHILPALSRHTHGEPLRQLPWIGLDEWWPGVCWTASFPWGGALQQASGGARGTTHALDGCTSSAATTMSLPGL